MVLRALTMHLCGTDSEAPFGGGGTAFGGGGTAPEQTTTGEGPSQAEDAPHAAGAKSAAGEGVSDFYDESYFDSDDGAAETADGASAEDPSAEPAAPAGKSRRRKKRPVIPNDTLFYDPDIDTENQQWMDRQRDLKGRNPFDEFGGEGVEGDGAPGSSASGDGDGAKPHDGQAAAAAEHNAKRGMQPTATSDAILNCSACMSTLCLDCQRYASSWGLRVRRLQTVLWRKSLLLRPRALTPLRCPAPDVAQARHVCGPVSGHVCAQLPRRSKRDTHLQKERDEAAVQGQEGGPRSHGSTAGRRVPPRRVWRVQRCSGGL